MENLTNGACGSDATIEALRARIATLEAALAQATTPPLEHIPEDIILNGVQDAVIVLDRERRIQFWNRAAEAIYGWSSAEAHGQRLQTLLQPQYVDGSDAAQALAAIEQMGSWTGLVIQRHRDGHELQIESSVSSLRDATGAVTGLVGVNRDVTTRVRDETARRLSDTTRALLAATRDDAAMLSELARLAVPTLGDWCAIHLVMADGTVQPIAIQHIDPARRATAAPFAQAYGLSNDITFGIAQVLRTGEPELVPDLKPERLDAMIVEAEHRPLVQSLGLRSAMCVPLKSGESVFGTITFVTAESGRRYHPADLRIACDLAERVAQAIAHARLTREVQAAAERTDATLAMLTALLTSAAIGVAFLDREFCFTQLNATLAAINGHAAEAFLGKSVFTMLPEYTAILHARLQSVLATGTPLTDIEVTIAAGTTVQPGTYMMNYYPVRGPTAQIAGIGVVVLDITERKRLQAQLIQSQKLEGIGRLAGGIAHDFNNLMTAILGYAELVADALPTDTPVQQDLAAICAATRRAAGLTRQLLAFARKQVLEPAVIALNDLVGDVTALLQRLIGADITLATQCAPELWPVRADPGQIEQVLINLAVNARDAMPMGGHLTIETANVMLDAAYARTHLDVLPGAYVRIAVTDTGTGMPPAVQARIFEPFFTTKATGEGTGLGLATSYGIVQQHGGAIWVYSEVGRGTTFTIYLPRVQADVEPLADAPPDVALPHGSETVLLVEDEEGVRTLTARVLRKQGYTVLEARDGQHALELVATYAQGIDLVLTDMVMPRLGGGDLGTALNARMPHIKVLRMSGYTEHAMVQRGALEPATPLLQKPFAVNTLLLAVRRVLDAPAGTTP